MTTSPDKLFRDQLNDFRKPAPQLAWERIEAKLETKKKGSFLWLKIAAMITIPVATYLAWPTSTPKDVVSIEKATPSISQPILSSSTLETKPESATQEISSSEIIQQDVLSKHKRGIENKSVVKLEIEKENKDNTSGVLMSENSNLSNQDMTTTPVEENISQQQTIAIEATPQKSNTLHYSTGEVNTRFKKKVTITQATPETKNPSILQTIGDIAYDIKNEDGLLGDLREKKNEIFSLDRLSPRHGPNK